MLPGQMSLLQLASAKNGPIELCAGGGHVGAVIAYMTEHLT